MKHIFLLGLLISITETGFCSDQSDSIKVDKQRIEKVIQEIKDQYVPSHYGIISKDYNIFDVTFVYPDKISSDDTPWIEVKWKNETI